MKTTKHEMIIKEPNIPDCEGDGCEVENAVIVRTKTGYKLTFDTNREFSRNELKFTLGMLTELF